MAEGRMLKRNISESRRLSQLKTDSARLLWTWIIPFLDSEGRFYASADMIKGKVVPRLPSFTEKNIPKYLEDMADVGLIALYEVDGEILLQYRKFEVFQKIVKSREAAPLPGPDEGTEITTLSGLDQDLIGSESRPPLRNIREVNLSKEKGSKCNSVFLEFYSLYPKPVKKKQALVEWKKAAIPENIIELLRKQIRDKETLRASGAFVAEWPDPERWIKHERWNDEIGGNGNGKRDAPGPGIPREYTGETEHISDQQRAANVERIKQLAGSIGSVQNPDA